MQKGKNLRSGVAWLQDMKSYEIHRVDISRSSLIVSHMVDESCTRQSEIGPHFVLLPITSGLLGSLLRDKAYEPFESVTYEFSGPVLGLVRECSGYSAASSGGEGRPVEAISMSIRFSKSGLEIGIKGQAGYKYENDCGSPVNKYVTRRFSLDFEVPVENIPSLVDIRSAANTFERKYLGSSESTSEYPKL